MDLVDPVEPIILKPPKPRAVEKQNFKKNLMKPKVVFDHKYATPGFDNSKTTYILTYFQHTAL